MKKLFLMCFALLSVGLTGVSAIDSPGGDGIEIVVDGIEVVVDGINVFDVENVGAVDVLRDSFIISELKYNKVIQVIDSGFEILNESEGYEKQGRKPDLKSEKNNKIKDAEYFGNDFKPISIG